MANIRVDLDYTIQDGSNVIFRSPCDCTEITGLIVYYITPAGEQASMEFALADAHGENVGDIPHLFASDVVVKVILDVTSGMAFVQNADTNAYLEGRFEKLEEDVANVGKPTDEQVITAVNSYLADHPVSGLSSAEKSLLLSLFKNAVFTADMSATIAQLETLWSETPDAPESGVEQIGNILSIVSGVTVSQSGSVLDVV